MNTNECAPRDRVEYVHTMFIIGLGNPGDAYERTRHNIGRVIVERLAREAGAAWARDGQANALRAETALDGTPATLVLPETYMNRSGETAAYFARAQNAAPDAFVVVHDEVDLPLGTLRIAKGRGDGGHNGLKSLIAGLGSKDFIRVRVGIAPTSFWTGKVKRPAAGGPLERFVLARFSRSEERALETVIPRACEAITAIVTDGADRAMNRFNG